MGISKVSNRWLNRAYKCIAIFLVSFAVLISALRLLLPYAHNYRQDLQNYINNTYSSNITIGSLEMAWQSSGPTLVAANVSLLRTDAAEVYVQAFDMHVDFWQSIRSRRLITKNFSLDGVKILFDKTMLNETPEDASLLDNISELFLSQIGRFSVKNSQIIFRTEKGQRTFLVSQLNWLNQGETHKAHGNVILDGLTSNNLQLNLDVKGEHIADMRGTLHLAANQLNITPWLDSVLAIDDENTHSTVNFNAWLAIDDGVAKQLQVQLGQNQIAWQHQEGIRTLNIDQGQIVFENLDNPLQRQIYSSGINVRSNEHTWQPINFQFKKVNNSLQGYVSKIDIAGVVDLLPLFINEAKSRDLIEQLNPIGMIDDLYINYQNEQFSSIAQFSGVNTQFSQGIPGVENVSGLLLYDNSQLQIDMSAEQGALDFDKHFFEPIAYQKVSSKLDVNFSELGWRLTTTDLNFHSEQLQLTAELGVFAEKDKDIEMSLVATASNGNTIDAQSFYPHLLMGNNLVEYLNGALPKGRIEQALVLINGPIKNFPFKDDSGVFVVDAELTDATFKFNQHWPAIQHFNANLNFTGNSMLITGRDGVLNGIDVEGVQAAIADMSGDKILKVDANFKETDPQYVTNLMLTSPLDESVGAVLEKVVISDNISGNFHLSLPLNDTSKAIAKGQVTFNNNIIDLQSPQLHFSQVNGTLSYNNEKIDVTGLSMLWRGMPLTLDVAANDQELHYQTNIAIDAQWQDKAWLAQVPELLKHYGEGSLDWQGALTLKNFHDGEFSYQFDIQSDLVNTKLNLPAPFNKAISETLVAEIKVLGDQDQSTIAADIGEQFNFYGNLNHQLVTFTQAHLILGHEEMYVPMNGFHITTNLAVAEFDQWQPLVSDIIDSIPQKKTSQTASQHLLEQPQRIRGNIGKLNFLGESLNGVLFTLEDEISWWNLELSSKEARAEVKFYPDWLEQGLDVNADFIHLAPDKLLIPKADDTKLAKEPTIEKAIAFDIRANDELFANIPPMRIDCEECSYANLNLGKVSFSVEKEQENTLAINNFVAKRKGNKLTFDAKWQHDALLSKTDIKGAYNSKDIEREFERLGLPSTVRDSALKSKFDLNWLGGPQNFAIAHLNGDVSGKLDEGYLAEVPDQARALSILSLQSLVRKLKFDFRDMFSDGMFYSEVKGDFHVNNGVVYTKNTFLKGAAGNLSVKGNTDLNSEALDYSMSYKPNITSSLPAIAWIATTNPVTFLAGIALNEVITSNVVSEYKFEITGSISEPSVKEVDRKTQNISVGRDTPPQIVEVAPKPIENNSQIGIINPETGLLEVKEQLPQDNMDG